MSVVAIQRSVSYSVAQRALLGLICALFLSAQTAEFAHSHDGDFLSQFECETCFQASSDDDDSVLTGFELHFGNYTEILTTFTIGGLFVSPISPQSRAPPAR
ncbi:hypothetical protein N9478_08725 [Gammaproteobacteria bacterium]|nr:hypothetical protein [Gammaproteobacteria bacterium]